MDDHETLTLKVSVKDGKECEKILKVEVAAEHIQKEYEEFYRSVTPNAKIPGFRPGKAPREIIAMHFKSEARDAVLKNLLSSSYHQAVKDQLLEPMGYPEIRDVKFDDLSLSYQAAVEIRPKIKLARVKGLSAVREKVSVTPGEIEDQLKRVQDSLAQFKAVENRPAAMGDFVIADYTCTADGKEVEKRNDDWFELKEEEFLKGFSAQLAGVKAGEERQVKVTFPEMAHRPDLSQKPAVFNVKIKEIKEKTLPSLDDELARQAGDCKTLAELREKIEKELLAHKEQHADSAYEKALLDELVKQNKMDLPPKFVEKRLEYLLEQEREMMVKRGLAQEAFEKQKEKMKQTLAEEARRQVHVAFLLDEIAVKENITVTEEDLKNRYSVVAGRFRQPVEEVEKYYSEHEDAQESLRDQIRSAKAIAFIKENAKPKDKS